MEVKVDKLLTIAIPTYNRYKNISNLLNNLASFLAISTLDIEICVVDNHSEYDINILKNQYAGIEEIKIYRNDTNLGFDGNILEIIKKSKGKYILFFGDDDNINFNNFELLYEELKMNDYDGVFLNYSVLLNKKNSLVQVYDYLSNYKNLNLNEIINLLGEKITFMSSIVLKREIINLNSSNIKLSMGKYFMHLAVAFDTLKESNNILYFNSPIAEADGGNPPTYDHFEVFIRGLGQLLKIHYNDSDLEKLEIFKLEIALFVFSNKAIVSSEYNELDDYLFNSIKIKFIAILNLYFGCYPVGKLKGIYRKLKGKLK